MANRPNKREYRNFSVETRTGDSERPEYRVEGYASTFEPYLLYSHAGVDYFEQVDPKAFDEADLSDVVFRYNHEGMVYARRKNGTLEVAPDEHGLRVSADLSQTAAAREMFESIRAGMVDQMSFAFTVREDSYDKQTHTRTILKVEKVYDVSAVSIPANPGTDISAVSARDYFNGVIEAEKAERLEREQARRGEPNKKTTNSRGGCEKMTYNEINYLNMDGINAKLTELAERKSALSANEITDEVNAELRSIANTVEVLEARKGELAAIERRRADADAVRGGAGSIHEDGHQKSVLEQRAEQLVKTGKMELRAALLSSGVLTPTAVKQEIGELPEVMSTIVDDVHSFSLDKSAGAWTFAYRKTDGTAEKVTEGDKIGGEFGTFDNGKIDPETWGILDEISNMVKHLTPLAYEQSVRNNAYLALRRYAKRKVTEAIVTSDLADKEVHYDIDANFLRNLVLGFNADESVAGGAKLYLTKTTLAKIGAIRGANEKRALFDITFSDENNGVIKEGGMSVNFSILSDLDKNAGISALEGKDDVMIYGQMGAVDMPLWGNYAIETDEGGGYFARNMMGIRGIQTAGVGVTRKHAVQVININP